MVWPVLLVGCHLDLTHCMSLQYNQTNHSRKYYYIFKPHFQLEFYQNTHINTYCPKKEFLEERNKYRNIQWSAGICKDSGNSRHVTTKFFLVKLGFFFTLIPCLFWLCFVSLIHTQVQRSLTFSYAACEWSLTPILTNWKYKAKP